MQNGYVDSCNGRMRDELLNETLFLSMAHTRVEFATWVGDYNRERPHSSLGYETPLVFAVKMGKLAYAQQTGRALIPVGEKLGVMSMQIRLFCVWGLQLT